MRTQVMRVLILENLDLTSKIKDLNYYYSPLREFTSNILYFQIFLNVA